VTERLLSASEVAERLNVPESWVREQTRTGTIPHIELGRYRRYDWPAVVDWLEGLAGGGGPRFRRYHPTPINGPRDA
jgi:excisionase family DNA binding protein